MCIWTVEQLENFKCWIDLLLDVAFPAEVISVSDSPVDTSRKHNWRIGVHPQRLLLYFP